MPINLSGNEIATILSSIGVIILGLLQLRKWWSEAKERQSKSKSNEADAVESGASASKAYAEASRLMAIQNKDLLKRVTTLERKMRILEGRLEKVLLERDSFKDWAERLLHQMRIQAPTLVPVAFRKLRKRL